MDSKLTLKNKKMGYLNLSFFILRLDLSLFVNACTCQDIAGTRKKAWTCNVNTLIHVHMYIHMFLTIRISQGIVYFSAT
jgi:hypothetical protein